MSTEYINPLSMTPDERAATFDARYAAAKRGREMNERARFLAMFATGDDALEES